MYVKNAVVTTLPKTSRQNTRKSFARIPKMMKKLCVFQTKLFLLKMFVRTCTMIFWQACRNLLPRIRKTFHKSENVEVTIFWSEFFFIKNYSLTTDNAILTTLPKIFLQKTTDLPLTFQEMARKIMNFSKENCFSSNCASVRVECICDHPVKTFSSKLWKLFAGIPQMTKKW